MERSTWTLAKEVAERAAKKAGELARSRFGSQLGTQMKDERGDLVTEIDLLADRLIVDEIMSVFPTHRIYSEEAGEGGAASEWVWHVDPLDGTNNYAIGLPLYGVCISLSYQGQIILGVVYDSHLGMTYTAVHGDGAWQEDVKLAPHPQGALAKSSISWIQGHVVKKDNLRALRLRHHLEFATKRVLRLWAPSIAWAMLARGDLHGIVLYDSEGEDLYAGLLLAQEAGVKVTDFAGKPLSLLSGGNEGKPAGAQFVVAAVPAYHDELLRMVQEGLAE